MISHLNRRGFLGLMACSPFLGSTRALERIGRPRAYSFTLIVAGRREFTDEEADRLFEAGCDDGTIASSCGVAYIMFTREADSFLGAIKSAMADVRKAGLDVAVVRIEAEDLKSI